MPAQKWTGRFQSVGRGHDVLTLSTRKHSGQTCDVLVSCGVSLSESGLYIIKLLPRIPNAMLVRLSKVSKANLSFLEQNRERERNNLFC